MGSERRFRLVRGCRSLRTSLGLVAASAFVRPPPRDDFTRPTGGYRAQGTDMASSDSLETRSRRRGRVRFDGRDSVFTISHSALARLVLRLLHRLCLPVAVLVQLSVKSDSADKTRGGKESARARESGRMAAHLFAITHPGIGATCTRHICPRLDQVLVRVAIGFGLYSSPRKRSVSTSWSRQSRPAVESAIFFHCLAIRIAVRIVEGKKQTWLKGQKARSLTLPGSGSSLPRASLCRKSLSPPAWVMRPSSCAFLYSLSSCL